MSRFFSRSPIGSKQNLSPKSSEKQLLLRKFQQCINSEQDFVRNVGYFLEKLKLKEFSYLEKTINLIKIQIKSSKSVQTEKFLSLLLLKTLFDCDETNKIASYSAIKILRRLRIIAEKAFISTRNFSPFFFKKSHSSSNNKPKFENQVFIQLLLECIKFWGFKYKPHLLDKTLLVYRKTYQDLVKKGVIFPENYRFFFKDKNSFPSCYASKETFENKGQENSQNLSKKKETQPENVNKNEITPAEVEISNNNFNEQNLTYLKKNLKKSRSSNDLLKIPQKEPNSPKALIESNIIKNDPNSNEKPSGNCLENTSPIAKKQDFLTPSPIKQKPCQSLNLEDFLSKVSSDDESPLQTPPENKSYNNSRDCVSFQQLSECEMKKLQEKASFSKKIEGLLSNGQKASLRQSEQIVGISTTSLEECINKEKEKEICREENPKQQSLGFKKEETHLKKQEDINLNKEIIRNDQSNIGETFKKEELPLTKEEEIRFLSEEIKEKNQIIESLRLELAGLRHDFQELMCFSLHIKEELDKSLLKNADLTLCLEALRRENKKVNELRRDSEDLLKLKGHYEDLSFQYETLINDKMQLEIERKQLKSQNQQLLNEIERLQNCQIFEKTKKSEKKVEFILDKENVISDRLDNGKIERRFSLSESEEPNFLVNKSFDFGKNGNKKTLETKKSLSFYEEKNNKMFSFEYIEGKTLDSDVLQVINLIKTDKFYKDEEHFIEFCLRNQGKVLENECLSITFSYSKSSEKEIILELNFYNKTDIEITAFQSKVVNPRSIIY